MLRAARRALTAEFVELGVERVEYVAALPDPKVWVWLGTDTCPWDLPGRVSR